MITYPHQLTRWENKKTLEFAEKQLKKYGAKEGKDYIWKERGDQFAIFTLR